MSNLLSRLPDASSLLEPIGRFIALPALFLLTTAISETPAYFAALVLILAADTLDSSRRNWRLVGDIVAGSATVSIALVFSDLTGVAVGLIVAIVAALLVQKSRTKRTL